MEGKKKKISMEIVNPNAAGIDIGSRSHFVAVGQGDDDVREFGVYNEDLKAIAQWLREHDVKTVAMESTGTYWSRLSRDCFVASRRVSGDSLQWQIHQKH